MTNYRRYGLAVVPMALLGALYAGSLVAEDRPVVASVSDDDLAFDCRVHGNRVCGSDVTRQAPGAYAAPDGGEYTVVLVEPYDACVKAATNPGPSGFAPEVCESLLPDFQHGSRIELGVQERPDGTLTPPLAEDIARTCRSLAPACIRSVIDSHRVR